MSLAKEPMSVLPSLPSSRITPPTSESTWSKSAWSRVDVWEEHALPTITTMEVWTPLHFRALRHHTYTYIYNSIIFFGRSNPADYESRSSHKESCWMLDAPRSLKECPHNPTTPTKMLPLDRSLSRKLRRWCRLHTSPPWSSFLPTYWAYRSRFFGGVSHISDRLMGYIYIHTFIIFHTFLAVVTVAKLDMTLPQVPCLP